MATAYDDVIAATDAGDELVGPQETPPEHRPT
jgi:hypothetical protein